MACLGVEPGVAEWKAQTNPLSYGGTPEANLNIFDFRKMNAKIKLLRSGLNKSN